MRVRTLLVVVTTAVGLGVGTLGAATQTTPDVPTGKPEAVIDLATENGVRLVKGQWRYSDTKIIEVDFRGPGEDKQPTGDPIKTYDFTPHAGWRDFDDSEWEVVEPATLDKRRSTGKLCFNWYRITVTIPKRVGSFDPTGSTVVFETSVDDYAEIWVDGELTRGLGQNGGSVVSGWNAPNRLVVGRNVQPGQKIQLAVFGINGPLSNPPTNFIYLRFARRGQRRSRPARSGNRRDRAPEPEDLQARGGLHFHRGADLGAGWRLSAVQRPEQQHHLQVHPGRTALSVS